MNFPMSENVSKANLAVNRTNTRSGDIGDLSLVHTYASTDQEASGVVNKASGCGIFQEWSSDSKEMTVEEKTAIGHSEYMSRYLISQQLKQKKAKGQSGKSVEFTQGVRRQFADKAALTIGVNDKIFFNAKRIVQVSYQKQRRIKDIR